MDNGQYLQRNNDSIVENDIFASGITTGQGSYPESTNPDIEDSLNVDKFLTQPEHQIQRIGNYAVGPEAPAAHEGETIPSIGSTNPNNIGHLSYSNSVPHQDTHSPLHQGLLSEQIIQKIAQDDRVEFSETRALDAMVAKNSSHPDILAEETSRLRERINHHSLGGKA